MSDDIKNAVEGIATAFEEFKATNDARLADIEKKGSSDPLVEEKLKNIEADLDRFEDINQKLTLAQQQQKQVDIKEVKKAQKGVRNNGKRYNSIRVSNII